MKAASLGMLLSLVGGVAWAQTGDNSPSAPPQPPSVQAQQGGGMNAQTQHPDNGQAGTYSEDSSQGEIIQTPNGAYMVSEPQPNRGLFVGQGGNDSMQTPEPGPGPAAMGPHPRPPVPSKAAHFRIKGPDLALDIKCPEDEPVKACIEAASQLIDKAGSVRH